MPSRPPDDAELGSSSVLEVLQAILGALNEIADDPFAINEFDNPLRPGGRTWNLDHLFVVQRLYYLSGQLRNMAFLAVEDDASISGGFAVKFYDQGGTLVRNKVTSLPQDLRKNLFPQVTQCIQSGESSHALVCAAVTEAVGFPISEAVLVPTKILDFLGNAEPPSLAESVPEFYSAIADILRFLKSVEDPIYSYIIHELETNSIIFKIVTHLFTLFEGVDPDALSEDMTQLFEGLHYNIVVFYKGELVYCTRILGEDDRLMMHFIPPYRMKAYMQWRNEPLKLADSLYASTEVPTLVLTGPEVDAFVENWPNLQTLYQYMTNLLAVLVIGQSVPYNTLTEFLELFGLRLGSGVTQLPRLLNETFEYFGTTLITLINPKLRRVDATLEIITAGNNGTDHTTLRFIPYHEFPEDVFVTGGDSIDLKTVLASIKTTAETLTGHQYNVTLGININSMMDALATKNLNAIFGLKNMMFQLPLIASLGALFAGMQGLQAAGDEFDGDDNLVESAPPGESVFDEEIRAQARMLFDGFLKRGILAILKHPKKSFNQIRDPELAAEGYLGLDFDAIRKLIRRETA
jgi:hypothetical protein